MRTTIRLGLICSILISHQAGAQQTTQQTNQEAHMEELVVSAPFHKTQAETALPVGILSGDDLRRIVNRSLGKTLAGQLGVHNASFGPGVGLPIIRGQSGPRVQVLQDGTGIADASRLSPDHVNGIDPTLAERIEVIRGPATLLYGNGAIGGVVNVIDGRIPTAAVASPDLTLGHSHNTANDEDKTLFMLNAGLGQLNLHLDYTAMRGGRVDVPGLAVDEALIVDAHHDEDEMMDDDHAEEEEEEVFNTSGYIANSHSESDDASVGFSFVGERGYLGFSVNQYETDYGLPPGSHEEHHEEEGMMEEHEDEDEHGHEDEPPTFIRLELDQTRYDLAANLDFQGSWAESLKASINFTDYEHQEIEIEEGVAAPGTLFENQGYHSRFVLHHRHTAGWQGVLGLQMSSTEFAAAGAEAFIPKTEDDALALFIVERLDSGNFTWELGARAESISLDPGSQCDQQDTTISASASLLYDLNSQTNLLVGASLSERAASIEERFSNVDAATCKLTEV
ncbi:MAG: TonB-dependent receptor, partial [Pseudomonadales bacterium]